VALAPWVGPTSCLVLGEHWKVKPYVFWGTTCILLLSLVNFVLFQNLQDKTVVLISVALSFASINKRMFL
jgi:hypothetical protein